MKKEIADIRKDYMLQTLDESNVKEDAIDQFSKWWNEAVNSAIDEVNAMALATVSKEGVPSARIVLLKDYDQRGFVFFTNYNSQKGNDLKINPHAALVFFWKELERQIRIQGVIEKINSEENDIYFFSRPIGSRIGAWTSPQSAVIDSRKILEENVKLYTEQFGENIPRPPYWGGYRVMPIMIEFWQGRSNRLHDRIRYSKNDNMRWRIERLAP
jgi:pyridoxamine 5'-phosphate oxidase